MPFSSRNATPRGNAHTFTQSRRCILTGFHFAPLRPSFTSVPLQSTCCFLLLCSPCGHWLRSRVRWHDPTLIRLTPYATLSPFTVCPSLPAVALLSTPACGTRRQFRRASSIALTASSQATVPASVRHEPSFFWPQALLTCLHLDNPFY
ncbi:MAG: hypothetical protein JWP81_472 [Ferruginibacter sp.]|nr:hypothetical protein [Ferruginibacter sp.]